MPEHWRGKAHTRQVYLEFRHLFQSRVMLLLHEILGCVTAPLLLCFALPRHAPQILEFMRNFTAYSEGVGHVCSFALFDFERHGDTRYGAPSAGVVGQRSCLGKMEKAYVSFRIHHPSWQDERGDELLENVVGPGGAEATQTAAAAAAHGNQHGCPPPYLAALSQSSAAATRSATRGAACSVSGTEMSAHAADGRGAMSGGESAIGGSVIGGGSSLGASQLLLLSGSSQLLALAPYFGQSIVGLGASHAPHSTAALSSLSPPMASALASAASSDLRTQQLAADLYTRMDQFYVTNAPHSASDVETGGAASGAFVRELTMERAVGDAGNYELTLRLQPGSVVES